MSLLVNEQVFTLSLLSIRSGKLWPLRYARWDGKREQRSVESTFHICGWQWQKKDQLVACNNPPPSDTRGISNSPNHSSWLNFFCACWLALVVWCSECWWSVSSPNSICIISFYTHKIV